MACDFPCAIAGSGFCIAWVSLSGCASLKVLLAGDIFLEKAVEHSLHRRGNQIGIMGNTKVSEWVQGSIHQQFHKIRDVVRAAGGEIHGCIFRGVGHLYIPSDPAKPELVGARIPCVAASTSSCMLMPGCMQALL